MRLIDADNADMPIMQRKNGDWVFRCNLKDLLDSLPTVEAVPVEFIKEQIDKYYRLSAHSIPKVEKEYLAMAKHLRDLIGDWEMFGEKQNKGE